MIHGASGRKLADRRLAASRIQSNVVSTKIKWALVPRLPQGLEVKPAPGREKISHASAYGQVLIGAALVPKNHYPC